MRDMVDEALSTSDAGSWCGNKPRVKKIPRSGLSWSQRYADVGDLIQFWPIRESRSRFGFVTKVHKNKYGRISYHVNGGYNQQVMTEELTPLKHKGACK